MHRLPALFLAMGLLLLFPSWYQRAVGRESGGGRPLQRAPGADRPGADPPDRGTQLSGRRGPRGAQGPHRLLRSVWAARSPERCPDAEGRHLPALLDDEAVHIRGGAAAGRGWASALDGSRRSSTSQLAKLEVAMPSTDASGKPTYTLVAAERPVTLYDLLRHTSGSSTQGSRVPSISKSSTRKPMWDGRTSRPPSNSRRSPRCPWRASPGRCGNMGCRPTSWDASSKR